MLIISKYELHTRMFEILDQIEQSSEEVIVTEQNQPLLRILPFRSKAPVKHTVEEVFADWQGKVVFYEDLNTPTIDEWTEV